MATDAIQPPCTAQSTAARLNDADGYSGTELDAIDVFQAYTDTSDVDGGTRPRVLEHQIPTVVGEALLMSVPLTPLYQYHRDSEQTTAWRVGETSQALIRIDTRNRTTFMLPAFGEACNDVFWMLAFSLKYRHPFTLTYLTENALESVLAMTRPPWRGGVEQLFHDHYDQSARQQDVATRDV